VLISADILACGLASLAQSLALPKIGIRMPVMMGVTFASVAPMRALITAAKEAGGANFVPDIGAAHRLRFGHRRGNLCDLGGSCVELAHPPASGGRHGFDHSGHRRVPDEIGVDWAEGPRMVPNVVDGVFKGMIPNPDRDALGGFGPPCSCFS
jgi:hypothetical protein